MLFSPLYGPSLKEYKDKMNSTILSIVEKRDMYPQIMNFHYNFVVHNDVKPSNIVRTHEVVTKTVLMEVDTSGESLILV